jgi:hypothetical protein
MPLRQLLFLLAILDLGNELPGLEIFFLILETGFIDHCQEKRRLSGYGHLRAY